MTFSRRVQWNPTVNELTIARAAAGRDLLDLTGSNPTRAGIDYPLDELSEVMARAARLPYDPQPLGLHSAREALAEELDCAADDVVITASTSEAYSYLFKLLCDPGDHVVTATPSYPLLEHLAALESIGLRHVPMELHARWELDAARVGSVLDERSRAIIVINPNNPTGSYITPDEQNALAALGIPLISDEVFHPFAFDLAPPSIVRDDVLTFTLGGLSKSAGLPHYKLGWIRISGPAAPRREALAALELIADNFLSVATPAQAALPELLPLGAHIRAAIRARTAATLAALRATLAPHPAAQLLPLEGGWSAVLRLPRTMSDEQFAVHALRTHAVLLQPGYFFDFERDGYFVVSLLTEPAVMREGVGRIVSEM